MPCRAQIWWIRAVPNISVPCPHDPVPCQIFPCRALMIRAQKYGSLFCGKKRRLRQRTHKFRASKNLRVIFLGKKKRLRQCTHKFRASRNMGSIFLEKKSACGNVPTKIKILKIKIRSAQNVGKVFISRKKTFPAPFGALPAHFLPKKKSACGNVPTSSGLVKIWGPFF